MLRGPVGILHNMSRTDYAASFFAKSNNRRIRMKVFDYSLVKDPRYFKDGRMDAHSDHTYYRDGEEAKEKETSFRLSAT